MTTMRVVGECFFWYRLTRVFPGQIPQSRKTVVVVVVVVVALMHSFGDFSV